MLVDHVPYEHVESRLVHDALIALAPRDPRRHAYLQLTQESTGFLTAWPSDTHACSPLEFREMFAMYFGLPSPIIHAMQIVGVRFHVPTGAHYTCDAHGWAISRATIADGEHQSQARTTEPLVPHGGPGPYTL